MTDTSNELQPNQELLQDRERPSGQAAAQQVATAAIRDQLPRHSTLQNQELASLSTEQIKACLLEVLTADAFTAYNTHLTEEEFEGLGWYKVEGLLNDSERREVLVRG